MTRINMVKAFVLTGIILVFALVITELAWCETSIVSLVIREKAGANTTNYPLTFGHVFKKGDVTGSVAVKTGDTLLPTQVDIKTRYSDNSIRHAVISVILPKVIAKQDLKIVLVAAPLSISSGLTKTAILATDIGAMIRLSNLSDSGYSGNLTADVRSAINASENLRYWLQGAICTEILVDQRLNNSLNATWEVRFYPGTPYVRISHALENVEANYRGNINYTLSVSQGNTNPATVYGPKTITHLKNSRWRKVFWLGQSPPEIEIRYDTSYLISTGHIMPYDTSLSISDADISKMVSTWESRDTDIFGTTYIGGAWYSGLANMYFPATGGRPEIGLLPKWAVMYLLTWDNRLRDITLRQAELLANAPIHWREYDPSKTFYSKVISIGDRSKIMLMNEIAATSSSFDPLPKLIGTTTSNWSIDAAHQGSFNYIPYMLTGEYFYLQEMYYWAGWNLAKYNYDTSWGRNYSSGIIRDQIRGVAWALRNIADAAAISPDSDEEKAYFISRVNNNINYRVSTITAYPLRNMSGSDGEPSGMTEDVLKVTSPWMEDFCLLSFVHIGRLGFDMSSLVPEYSKFIIGRFSNPDFNWFNGAPYRFPTTTTSGVVKTWAQANSLYSTQPTSFANPDYPYSYNFIALAALSQVINQSGGQSAYEWLKSKINSKELLKEDPTWALVPLGPGRPKNLIKL